LIDALTIWTAGGLVGTAGLAVAFYLSCDGLVTRRAPVVWASDGPSQVLSDATVAINGQTWRWPWSRSRAIPVRTISLDLTRAQGRSAHEQIKVQAPRLRVIETFGPSNAQTHPRLTADWLADHVRRSFNIQPTAAWRQEARELVLAVETLARLEQVTEKPDARQIRLVTQAAEALAAFKRRDARTSAATVVRPAPRWVLMVGLSTAVLVWGIGLWPVYRRWVRRNTTTWPLPESQRQRLPGLDERGKAG
jgi:hypothetical protein